MTINKNIKKIYISLWDAIEKLRESKSVKFLKEEDPSFDASNEFLFHEILGAYKLNLLSFYAKKNGYIHDIDEFLTDIKTYNLKIEFMNKKLFIEILSNHKIDKIIELELFLNEEELEQFLEDSYEGALLYHKPKRKNIK